MKRYKYQALVRLLPGDDGEGSAPPVLPPGPSRMVIKAEHRETHARKLFSSLVTRDDVLASWDSAAGSLGSAVGSLDGPAGSRGRAGPADRAAGSRDRAAGSADRAAGSADRAAGSRAISVTVVVLGDDASDYLGTGERFALWDGHDLGFGVITRRVFV
jgi:hypothetical protein